MRAGSVFVCRNKEVLMSTMEARELEEHIIEVLRRVEEGETIEVTRQGKVVARVVPALGGQTVDRDANGAWSELLRLRDEITADWPEGISAQEAVNDVRRDL
jgi:prevent-host-death family protein